MSGLTRLVKPSRAEIESAAGKTVPDLIGPGLRVLFVGINPSLYSGAVGHHFARPGNRFWPVLHQAGFTPRQLSPFEERELLELGVGVTNIVERATASADELSPSELREGAEQLANKVQRFGPAYVAVVGVSAYRTGFGQPKASLGLQPELLGGARVWVLPNPSGLQAHYQLPELVRLYGELRQAAFAGAALRKEAPAAEA